MRAVKWWIKIPAKMILSRLPIPWSLLRKFSMFRHGDMDDSAYALDVVEIHHKIAKPFLKKGFTALELGPGDSLLSAFIITSLGADKVYLVDVGDFATKELEPYTKAVSFLKNQNYDVSFVDPNARSVDEFFKNINLDYLTNGLKSLRTIPDSSVDFIWSHAVLEHVRAHEFDEVMTEFHRILTPKGICSHVVDFRDHLDDSLNNLRFSEKLWESDFFANSGFYTNRISPNHMIKSFKKAGFEITSRRNERWDKVPIDKTKFASPFSEYDDDNLIISGYDVVLRRT